MPGKDILGYKIQKIDDNTPIFYVTPLFFDDLYVEKLL